MTTRAIRSGLKKRSDESRVASKSGTTKALRLRPEANRKDAALLRLFGRIETPLDLERYEAFKQQVAQAPPISELVTARALALQAMRFSDDPCVKVFLQVYDRLNPSDRDRLPLEAIGVKAGVNLNELLGAILIAFKNTQAKKSVLLAMEAHPEVLGKRIEFAKLPGGSRDRDALDQAVGFLPTPKGMSIAFNMSPNAGASKPAPEAPVLDDDDVNSIFPVITAHQEGWQEKRQKLLAPKN